MQLIITKNEHKPNTVLYRRDDGTQTWMNTGDFFVRHDLSHYVIEKTLGYKTAFMGMINNGMNIRDFEDREKRMALQLTPEGVFAENMANLFLMEYAKGICDDMNQVIRDSFVQMGLVIEPPVLSQPNLSAIRAALRDRLNEWARLISGQSLILEF